MLHLREIPESNRGFAEVCRTVVLADRNMHRWHHRLICEVRIVDVRGPSHLYPTFPMFPSQLGLTCESLSEAWNSQQKALD